MGRPTARVDRRRRHPPSSTSFGSASSTDCSSKFFTTMTAYARRVGAIPLIVAATCLLSLLIQVAVPNTPYTTEEMIQKFHNDYVNARSTKQRRSLLQVRDGEQDAFDPESGVISENLWHRQLSVVRTENSLAMKRQEERMKLRADERRARFGAKHWAGRITKELSDEFGEDSGRPMKRMAIIPRYVSCRRGTRGWEESPHRVFSTLTIEIFRRAVSSDHFTIPFFTNRRISTTSRIVWEPPSRTVKLSSMPTSRPIPRTSITRLR